ncbi:hypothetical protein SAMN02746065_110114 [Desulfocicer vacuolatum DSM 3385]|uniref:Uncharacterized protein n=1 Tax=Desulfocicer vacuolatum DSM 3385 TaxID=1121400 RepID=A0A1W2C3E4_9BACT|nr:hypothetical protein SAMN02746065_110114 [Desulfocicer vacuolatum DSM 3385]
MFEQCPIFACLGLRSMRLLCKQAKTGEDWMLTEYLMVFYNYSIDTLGFQLS